MSLHNFLGLDKLIQRSDQGLLLPFTIRFLWFLLAAISVAIFLYNRSSLHLPRGCRRLGLRSRTNLSHELAPVPEQEKEDSTTWRVNSLWIFPIKGVKGVELETGTVIKSGMEYDRQFSFAELKSSNFTVQEPESEKGLQKWEFVNQRHHANLVCVKTEMWVPDPSSPSYSSTLAEVQSGGVVLVSFPYEEDGWKGTLNRVIASFSGRKPEKSFQIPFNPTSKQIKENGYNMEQIKIWKDKPLALNMSSSLPAELSAYLGVKNPLGLFRIADNHQREVFRCAPRKAQIGYQPLVGFADAYPLHLMNIASCQDVSEKQDPERMRLSVLRFRANIVITGPPAYEEDSWKRIKLGDYEFHVSCRTARCIIPNIDPNTGLAHPKEPYKLLRQFRAIDPGAGKDACLGMQMVPAAEESVIRVGDRVEVLETGEHYYINQ
ncbi:hypothetical protein MMC19_003744 [Ptychographa xylographoides]|nr:hypothetical protein [Ptychographa xylographoides]